MEACMTARAEFLTERLSGLGGSDVAAVWNIGYGCRKRLWLQKRNTTPDYPNEETGPMKLGSFLEPLAASEYIARTGRAAVVEPMRRHPVAEWAIVHTDRVLYAEERGGLENPGVLEIKCLGRAVFAKTKREGLPEDYVLQLQHGMGVTSRNWGAFCAMSRDNGDLLHWDVEFDLSIWREIMGAGEAFWAQVENGPMPDTLEPDDKRCQRCEYRKSCQGAALIQISGTDVDRDDALLPLLAEYDERKVLFEEAEGLLDEVKEDLRTMMGDRGAVECAGGRKVLFRPTTRRTYDSNVMAEYYCNLRFLVLGWLHKHPELWERPDHKFEDEYLEHESYKRETVYRALRIY